MIGLALGTLTALGLALIVGRLKGRGYEVFMVLFGMPGLTYAISVAFAEDWPQNTYLCAVTCLNLIQWAGVEVFLSLLIAVGYSYLRARKSLSIDEYIQLSYMAIGIFAGAVVLSSRLLPALIIPGLLAYVLLLWPREGISLKFLKVERVELLEGVEVYTDEGSRMVFKDGERLFMGSKALGEFPHWRKLAECVLDIPMPGLSFRLSILLLGFLPAVLLLLVPRGIAPIALYGITVMVTAPLLGKAVTRRSRRAISGECPEVLAEYGEFIRKRKGKLDVVVD